jgi:hypothetical protein
VELPTARQPTWRTTPDAQKAPRADTRRREGKIAWQGRPRSIWLLCKVTTDAFDDSQLYDTTNWTRVFISAMLWLTKQQTKHLAFVLHPMPPPWPNRYVFPRGEILEGSVSVWLRGEIPSDVRSGRIDGTRLWNHSLLSVLPAAMVRTCLKASPPNGFIMVKSLATQDRQCQEYLRPWFVSCCLRSGMPMRRRSPWWPFLSSQGSRKLPSSVCCSCSTCY